jgi:very-short-patch-repair endonuclease
MEAAPGSLEPGSSAALGEVTMRQQSYSHFKKVSLLQQRAHAMRNEPTHAEEILWRQLRASQLGTSFRRQVVLGERYIADFVAPKAKLIVEVDGSYHTQRGQADARRERALARLGYRVLRLTNELIEQELPRALELIREAL